ncbi:translation initiation factor IF-2-like [Oenanthe melanoleuca]|uniref:translation initiation factor IF-2-like n=1 Tax=Oenanthe melanoleuca TaxID=2939378 RepID=UPI0024C20B43|nr:translation initiation factor IF-2-like [Oenanthe melanoleuca]
MVAAAGGKEPGVTGGPAARPPSPPRSHPPAPAKTNWARGLPPLPPPRLPEPGATGALSGRGDSAPARPPPPAPPPGSPRPPPEPLSRSSAPPPAPTPLPARPMSPPPCPEGRARCRRSLFDASNFSLPRARSGPGRGFATAFPGLRGRVDTVDPPLIPRYPPYPLRPGQPRPASPPRPGAPRGRRSAARKMRRHQPGGGGGRPEPPRGSRGPRAVALPGAPPGPGGAAGPGWGAPPGARAGGAAGERGGGSARSGPPGAAARRLRADFVDAARPPLPTPSHRDRGAPDGTWAGAGPQGGSAHPGPASAGAVLGTDSRASSWHSVSLSRSTVQLPLLLPSSFRRPGDSQPSGGGHTPGVRAVKPSAPWFLDQTYCPKFCLRPRRCRSVSGRAGPWGDKDGDRHKPPAQSTHSSLISSR